MRYARLIDVAVPRVTDPLFDEAERSEPAGLLLAGTPPSFVPGNIRKGESISDFHTQNMSDRYVPLFALPVPGPQCSKNNN